MKIKAKYPGRCAVCGYPVQVGEEIDWHRGRREVWHSRCENGTEAARRLSGPDIAGTRPAGESGSPPVSQLVLWIDWRACEVRQTLPEKVPAGQRTYSSVREAEAEIRRRRWEQADDREDGWCYELA